MLKKPTAKQISIAIAYFNQETTSTDLCEQVSEVVGRQISRSASINYATTWLRNAALHRLVTISKN